MKSSCWRMPTTSKPQAFVSHLKLPHYVDFQAELELLKRLQQEQNHG